MVAATCVGVGLAGESRLLLIVIDRVAEIVLVDKVVARVVRGVDVDHLDLAVIAALQELQHLKVVALDVDVVGVERAVLAVAATALFNARPKRCRARDLRLADGVGLAWPRERIALLALVDLVAKLQPQFVEVDSAFSEYLRH